jgi:hypothetical protein
MQSLYTVLLLNLNWMNAPSAPRNRTRWVNCGVGMLGSSREEIAVLEVWEVEVRVESVSAAKTTRIYVVAEVGQTPLRGSCLN